MLISLWNLTITYVILDIPFKTMDVHMESPIPSLSFVAITALLFARYLWKFVPIQSKEQLCGQVIILDEKTWLSFQYIPKFLLTKPRLYGPDLCTGTQSHWYKKWTSPNCWHKAGGLQLSKMSLYAVTLPVPFTGKT